jgi:hypothetical protein
MTEIDPKDRSEFTQEIGELHLLLDQFGSSHALSPPDADWGIEIRELHSNLNQLDMAN